MDTQNQAQSTNSSMPIPTPASAPVAMHRSMKKIWFAIMVVVLLVLVGASFTIYGIYIKTHTRPFPQMVTPQNTVTQEKTQPAIVDDSKKPEAQVNDEVINDIDNVQKANDDATFDEKQVDDLKGL